MSSATTVPQIDLSAGLVPKQPPQTQEAPIDLSAGLVPKDQPTSTPITDSGSISAAPKVTAGSVLGHVANVPIDPLGELDNALNEVQSKIGSYTQEGRQAHPILSRVGDAIAGARELLQGGQSAGKPEGTRSGVVNNPVTASLIPGEAAAEAAPEVAEHIPRIPSMARAGQATEALKNEIGTHPVEITDDLSKAVMRIQELADNGNTMPSVARKFIQRITNPEKGPLTYGEARDFYTKAGSLTADEQSTLAPVVKQALGQFAANLRQAVADTADRAGKLDQFQKSMSEYRNAKILQGVLDWAKDFSVKGLAQKAGATGALYELKKLIGQ